MRLLVPHAEGVARHGHNTQNEIVKGNTHRSKDQADAKSSQLRIHLPHSRNTRSPLSGIVLQFEPLTVLNTHTVTPAASQPNRRFLLRESQLNESRRQHTLKRLCGGAIDSISGADRDSLGLSGLSASLLVDNHVETRGELYCSSVPTERGGQ